MLNMIDEFTRECLAIRIGRKLNSTDVIDVLSDLFILRGVPGHVRSDNVLGQQEKRCFGKQVSMQEFAPAGRSSSIQAASTELEELSAIANIGSSGRAVALIILKTRCRSR
jgi:hypothetical protein